MVIHVLYCDGEIREFTFLTKPAFKKIAQIFTSGTLQQKHQQISLFMEDGHSLLYSGDVSWEVTFPSANKIMAGDAESIDHALFQIMDLLEDAMKTHNPLTEILLDMQEKSPA